MKVKMNTDNTQFSSREKEVIELLMQGKSNKEIALTLSISARTVEFHLKNVYGKLQVKSRAEAILSLGKTTASATASNEPVESTVARSAPASENSGNTISTRRITLKQPFYIVGGTLLAIVLVTAAIYARSNTNRSYVPPANTVEVSVTANPLMVEMGTSFVFPPGLGDGTEDAVIAQTEGMGYTDPQHIEITLVNYPLEGTTYKPRISVFPAKELAQMDPSCSKVNIDGLENILKTGQFSLADPLPCNSVEDSLPFAPHQGASQVFHVQEKILSFQNGSGIRYITDYSQAHYPEINNTEVFYTFQGLSSDGMWYVSVVLPINLAALDGAQAPITDSEYAAYLSAKKDLLNRTDNTFNPSLESLDTLVQSLNIGIQEQIMGTTTP